MTPLVIESTPKTPEVNFDGATGTLSIKGMSCAEYALDFYKPLFHWLDNYIKQPHETTTLNFQLKYYNTSSAKCILQLLERIARLNEQGGDVEVNWFYNVDDEQMIQDGENYSAILGLPIRLLELA